MTGRYRLAATERFLRQAGRLPNQVLNQLKARLELLQGNPRHPSLQTHEVHRAKGDLGNKVFELYVTDKHRATWEYGPGKGEIVLRNVDNHDDCLLG